MKLNLGSMEYEIILKNPIEEFELEKEKENKDEDHVYAGLIVPYDADLYISPEYEAQVKAQSFWHEVMHGVMDEIGRQDLYNDEGLIEAIAKQIYSILKNNDMRKIYEYLGAEKCLK